MRNVFYKTSDPSRAIEKVMKFLINDRGWMNINEFILLVGQEIHLKGELSFTTKFSNKNREFKLAPISGDFMKVLDFLVQNGFIVFLEKNMKGFVARNVYELENIQVRGDFDKSNFFSVVTENNTAGKPVPFYPGSGKHRKPKK